MWGNKLVHCRQEEAALAFALVYTGLEELLPRVKELAALAHRDGSKADREAARAALARVIQARSTDAGAGLRKDYVIG